MSIIQNAIMTPDGTILVSRSRHDFITYRDKNFSLYGVDGGLDYCRRIGNTSDCTNLVLTTENPIAIMVDRMIWGTRPAINAKQTSYKVVYRLLKDLDTEHLKNIAKTQKPTIYILMVIFYILNEREQLWK